MEVFLYNSTVCRLCGEENDNGNLLYSCEENNQNLCEIINSYLPIKVEDDGELSRTICPGCTIQLEATVEFLNLIINGQKVIRELYQREREYKKSVLNGSIVDDSDVSEKFIYKTVNTDDGVYPAEHPMVLQVAGLERPKKKRGRPPKKPKSPEEVASESAYKIQTPVAKFNKERREEDPLSGKRRRKTPTRFKEAVQGKELERIFIEVGVIDGEESDREVKIEGYEDSKPPESKEPEVIGHIEKSGELVVVVKNKGRGRPKGRSNQTREECAICGMEFVSRGRYMSHVASHGPVLYRCGCGEPFSTRLRFTEHQQETAHTGRTVEPCPQPAPEKPNENDVTVKTDSQSENAKTPSEDKLVQTSVQGMLPTLNAQTDVTINHPVDPLKIETTNVGTIAGEDVESIPDNVEEVETTSPVKKKLKCNNCDKVFSNRQSKSLHNKAVHLGEKNYACPECDARFAYPRSLAVHRVSHRRARPHRGFACDLCGKVLNHPSSVVYHKQAEHAEQRYVCGTCGKHFRHKQLLQRHQLVHSQLRPFHCKTCEATFKTKANLLNHQLLHTGVKKFTCEICKQKFAHKTSLTLHMRLHTGLKPFACEVCGKRFSQKGNLSEHERIHTGEKPYQCTLCPRRFTTSSQHRLHARRHEADRAHACSKCGKRFVSRNSWALHVRRDDCANARHRRTTDNIKLVNKQMSLLVNGKSTSQSQPQYRAARDPRLAERVAERAEDDNDDNVIYVAYDDDSQTGAFHILDPEQAVNIEESRVVTSCQLYSGSSLLVPPQLGTLKLESDELELLEEEEEEALVLSDGQSIPVTDEQGNPLHFTMQDGTKLAITSIDGQSLQVITQDGQTIPVEINGYNEDDDSPVGPNSVVHHLDLQKSVEAGGDEITHYFTIV